MPEYVITFCGHIDEHKRPHWLDEEERIPFPQKVYDQNFVQTDGTTGGLVRAIAALASRFTQNQGMSVRYDAYAIHDLSIKDLAQAKPENMWVPMHLITHITVKITGPITGETPGFDESGKLVNPSGKEIIKQ